MKVMKVKALSALAFLVYFASYVTRINYGAILSEIVVSEGIAKSSASLAVTLAFITYGIGQLIAGYIGDRLDPYKIIMTGLLASSAINILMSCGLGISVLTALWAVNGFAQSLIWPPLVRILASNLSSEDYNRACVTANSAGAVGTVFIYLTSPLLINISGWRSVFIFSSVIGITAATVFGILTVGISKTKTSPASCDESPLPESNQQGARAASPSGIFISSGLAVIFIAILFQGILRDGIQTWTPSFLSETYGLPTESSILSGVIIPLFGIFSLKLTSVINSRAIKNELLLSILLFSVSAVCTALSAFIRLTVLSAILMATATGCMHGINLLLVCQIPAKFVKYGRSSYISGLLNFFTYIGAALSTYGIAVIAESASWTLVLLICSAVAILGLAACLIAYKPWTRFNKD